MFIPQSNFGDWTIYVEDRFIPCLFLSEVITIRNDNYADIFMSQLENQMKTHATRKSRLHCSNTFCNYNRLSSMDAIYMLSMQ